MTLEKLAKWLFYFGNCKRSVSNLKMIEIEYQYL
jgi:hypothetical protein